MSSIRNKQHQFRMFAGDDIEVVLEFTAADQRNHFSRSPSEYLSSQYLQR